MSLHWLPVKSRVQFKLGLITYKVYKNIYPAYLENYVQPYRSIYTIDAANMPVIFLVFHIIAINSTNPLHACPIVFFY